MVNDRGYLIARGVLSHEYPSAISRTGPWRATFEYCCRRVDLSNNKGTRCVHNIRMTTVGYWIELSCETFYAFVGLVPFCTCHSFDIFVFVTLVTFRVYVCLSLL